MANRSFLVNEALGEYLSGFVREPDVLKRLREETAQMPQHNMQIGPDQGIFMAQLVHLLGVKSYLEVGVFTGYSSTSVALALPKDGKIVACDVSEGFTNVARKYWAEAGVADKIELRLAPAVETLDSLIAENRKFDLAFIDADKPNYPHYYERALKLVRQNGLILIDNVLWSGEVANSENKEESTEIIRKLNETVANDPRVESVLLTVGDGITFIRVR
jgi:predicted O-methyltransferase YrrM